MQNKLNITRWPWFIVLGVLLLTAWLQIHHLNQTSLWADEGWTIAATGVSSPVKVITEWVAVDVHPPLFFIELWGWRQFTGDTIFEMRFFSVLLTLLATSVMYRVGETMFKSEIAGLISAFFFGVHDLVRVLTQEVRHYPQQQLMVALTLWLYWRFWEKPLRGRGIVFILAGVGLLLSHYWGGFILLSMAIHALLTKRQRIKPYILSFVGIGIGFALWLPALYHQITLERPNGLPHALDNSWVVYKTLAYQLVGIPEFFWMGLAIFAVVGSLRFVEHRKSLQTLGVNPASVFLLLAVVLTVVLSLIINEAYPTLSFRSLAVIIPPLAGLVGYALNLFQPRERMVLLVFVVVQSIFTTSAGPVPRARWPDVAHYLAQHSTSNDLILDELDTDEYSVQYYLGHLTDKLSWEPTQTTRDKNRDEFATYLDDILQNVDGVWVAKLDWPFYDIRNDLQARGFVGTAEPITWPTYIGRPIELWRWDKVDTTVEPVVQFVNHFDLLRAHSTVHADWVTVNLIWMPSQVPDDQYTISVFLLADNGTIPMPSAQHDSWPLEGKSPTLSWQIGKPYFDSHVLATQGLSAGTYRIGLKIYHPLNGDYGNLEILESTTCADVDCTYTIIDTIEIH